MTDTATTPAQTSLASGRRRWIALIFIATAQLMVVFDASIMNIALPQAQSDLGFDDASRQWVITAYSLAFGALLLLAGRISDSIGRRTAFTIGLVGFALASTLGGLAPNIELLVAARVGQGIFAALLAPAALSLLSLTFPTGRERATAFGVFSAIAGAGGAIGLLLGGVLTEFATWRWTLLVNVVFAVFAIVGAIVYIRDTTGDRNRDRLDVVGTILASIGLAALVYGFSRAETDGWADGGTIASFVVAVVLLVAFVLVETRVENPLLPLRVVTDRNRGGAYLSSALAMAANFTQFLFLTYYMQNVLGFSPLMTGVAFLPLVLCLIIGTTQLGGRLITRVPARWLMGGGYLVGAVGMLWLSRISAGDDYWSVVLPASIVMGLGIGTGFMCSMVLATTGVQGRDTGVASAMVNTSQQIGGAVGTALMSTIAAGATGAFLTRAGSAAPDAAVHGYSIAFVWATGVLVLAAVVAIVLVRSDGRAPAPAAADSAPTVVH